MGTAGNRNVIEKKETLNPEPVNAYELLTYVRRQTQWPTIKTEKIHRGTFKQTPRRRYEF